MERRSASGTPDPDQIAELQARADAGDRNAAGYLQETTHDPEDWAFMEAEQLTRLLAERDDPQPRFVARWAEHEVPGSAGRSATWHARPFEQAKAMLISELRHNLSRWAAQSGSDPVRYTRALDTLEAARGPVTIDLPGHVLVIAEAPRHGQ